jgi:hypothetical protein
MLTGKHTDLTEKIIQAFFQVYRKVYDNNRKGSLAWAQPE